MTGRSSETLLERGAALANLGRIADEAGAGHGRLVLIGGEAGVGKTTVLRAFAGAGALWGSCEALLTPRPLGPFADVADRLGGELAERVAAGARPHEVLGALLAALARRPRAVVVLEDLHWADEATLDVLRLLGRRVEGVAALVLCSFRDDEVDRSHPLRRVLGELASAPPVRRLQLSPLSPAAVATLAEPYGVDGPRLHRVTGGNPFFVTEALSARSETIPPTVRDAVLARAARLTGPARRLLDAVAVEPAAVEPWLLERLAGDDAPALEEALASGILREDASLLRFRHELARRAVESAIPLPARLGLHRSALQALADPPSGEPDAARLAHHAEEARDGAAVLEHAPVAAERAARHGAHREAASQYARALRFAEPLDATRRAELEAAAAYESYLTNDHEEALAARRRALALWQKVGDPRRQGDQLRWISRILWFLARNEEAEAAGRAAVELLEPLPPGRELAMAWSNMAQLRMLNYDRDGAVRWGTRAIALAEELGESEILAHALNNVGTAEINAGGSLAQLERSLDLAVEHDLEEHVARARTNLAATLLRRRRYVDAERHARAGIAYCEHDLDSWRLYLTGTLARIELEQGRWDDAAATATGLLAGAPAATLRIAPLFVLGQLRARRGDPDPWSCLDEALAIAARTGELQRVAPVAAARAEALWLEGRPEAIDTETAGPLALAVERGDAGAVGELATWRRRAGLAAVADGAGDPWALELAGRPAETAAAWTALGCPYEAALALAAVDDDDALRRSLEALRELGAVPAAAIVARRLRARGVRGVTRGPRRSTVDHPASLTLREAEVLGLLADGLRNAEIAARLFLSAKTVDHHVSAILRKLGVRTRAEAGAAARRLDLVDAGPKMGSPPDGADPGAA